MRRLLWLLLLTASCNQGLFNGQAKPGEGVPNTSQSRLGAAPTLLAADGVVGAALQLTLLDVYDEAVVDAAVTFSSSGSGNRFTVVSGVTDGNGTFTTRLSSTTQETKTIIAAGDGWQVGAQVSFVAGPPVLSKSSMTASPNTAILANNSSASTITVTLRDSSGKVVPNYPLSIEADNVQSHPLLISGTTSDTGVFTFALRSSFAGSKSVVARTKSQNIATSVAFIKPGAYCLNIPFYSGGLPFVTGYVSNGMPLLVDMNGDSKLDLIVADTSSNTADVSFGNGKGGFGGITSTSVGTTGYTGNVVCDVNNDGHPDVVTSNHTTGSLSVLLGSATGALGTATVETIYGGDTGHLPISCVDMNHDGKMDIVLGNGNAQTLSIYSGDGTGSFTAGSTINLGFAPLNFALADVTGDGFVDVALPDDANFVHVCPANASGSGFGACVAYGVGAGNASVAMGDVTGDGKVDVISADTTDKTVSILANLGTGTFSPRTVVSMGSFAPSTVVLGDMNGDGLKDIVVTYASSNRTTVVIANGAGSFTPTSFNTGFQARAAAVLGDINKDGALDVMTSVAGNGMPGIATLLGAGDGTLVTPAQLVTALGASTRGAAVGDIDNDGDIDLGAVSNTAPYGASTFHNKGNGTFDAAVGYAVSDRAQDMAFVDLDGDSDLDLVVTLVGSVGGLSIRYNDGDGHFGSEHLVPVGSTAADVAWGDFNRDGITDLATANGSTGSGNTVAVLLGTGTGFATQVLYVVGGTNSNPTTVSAVDMDGDGVTDLVAGAYTAGQVGVLRGAGDGTFGAATLFTPAGHSTNVMRLMPGDFNLDGYTDIATVTNSDTLALAVGSAGGVLTPTTHIETGGQTVDATAADVNGDGIPDIIASATAQGAFGVYLGVGDGNFITTVYGTNSTPNKPVAADFNGDGKTDLAVACNTSVLVYLYTICP